MNNGAKTVGVVLGVAALAGVAIAAASKSGEEPNNGQVSSGAEVTIEIRDMQGNIVEHHSPYNLNAGTPYRVYVVVRNISKRGTLYTAATMRVSLIATSAIKTYMPLTEWEQAFDANSAVQFSQLLVSDINDNQDSGKVTVTVKDPNGNVVTTAENEFNIIPIPIQYAATAVFQ